MSSEANSRRSTWILIGLVAGALLGILARQFWGGPALDAAVAQVIKPIGNVFLRMIFMVVVPLILSAIILGVAELGDVRKLGRVGLKCVGMTALLSGVAVILGLFLVNTIKPGHAMSADVREGLVAQYTTQAGEKIAQAGKAKPLSTVLLDFIPINPLEEAVNAFNPDKANGGLIAVMVFGLIVGAAVTMLPTETVSPLTSLLEAIFRVCIKVIDFAMALAPLCVACLGFALTSTTGWDILGSLALYVVVVIGALAIHQFGTYSLAVWALGGWSPRKFFSQIRVAMITAFSTSSSNVTLPVSIRVAEENLKLPPQISRFVLSVGATANQNGTALYEGITVLFLAQVFGIELTFVQQLTVALMCILAGIGTAGIPGGSLPLVVGVLVTVGVPPQAIAIILGIDRLLDMCRTALNVTGDLVIATVVARGEQPQAA